MTTRQIKTCSRRGKEYKFRVICNQMSYQNQIFILVAIFFFFFLRSFISLLHYWYLVDEKWLHVYPFFGWSKINRRKLFSFLFPYFPPPPPPLFSNWISGQTLKIWLLHFKYNDKINSFSVIKQTYNWGWNWKWPSLWKIYEATIWEMKWVFANVELNSFYQFYIILD